MGTLYVRGFDHAGTRIYLQVPRNKENEYIITRTGVNACS
jgi:hypothetical protein